MVTAKFPVLGNVTGTRTIGALLEGEVKKDAVLVETKPLKAPATKPANGL